MVANVVSADECIIAVEDVHVGFAGATVLRGVTLTIGPGVSCIMGLSGTGKSTLLRTMIGLVRPSRGTVRFEGGDLADPIELARARSRVGYVFQNGALFTAMTVADNVALTLLERGFARGEVDRRVRGALARVGLDHAGHRYPDELSGGETKRAAIARALALQPDVLLFDEPTTGADPVTTTVLMRNIAEVTDTEPRASIVVTHDVDAVRRYADLVTLLADGIVVWRGSAREMDSTPNPAVRQFVAGALSGPLGYDGSR